MKSFPRLTVVVAMLLLLGLTFPFTFHHPPFPPAKANPSILKVPAGFATIQAAINAAAPGDTILVSPGTYRENPVITKSIRLVGTSLNNTIIDASGSGPGLNITAARGVYVSGFSIQNTGTFDDGILVSSSAEVTIQENRVQASTLTNGAYIVNSNSSVVRSNIFTGNGYGVSVVGGFGNLIQGNNATGNPRGADIYIARSSGNKVADNILRVSSTGLILWNGAVGNIIARNLIANDTSEGICIVNSPGNLFTENRIEFNRATVNTAGVSIQNSTLNRFYHNNILNNSIQVFGITAADISSNTWDNATSSPLKFDPRILIVDANSNGAWDFNETVVYDTDNDRIYGPGDIRIASMNGITTAPGTPLAGDPRIRFVDVSSSNAWKHGDPVAYDTNDNNNFDHGEPAITGVGGNYWSDYRGLDNGSHGFTGDGIGDSLIPTPCPNIGRPCSFGGPPGVDWYPLMIPWRPSVLNITISATPLGGVVSLQVLFTGSATGGLAPYNYTWSFGDGSVMMQQNSTHIYSVKGTYIATLTVVDAFSDTGSNQVSITALAALGNLAIQVLDQDMTPIQGANVTMLSTPSGQAALSTLTNNLGAAGFSGLAVGAYIVQASSPGYQTATKNVTVVSGQTTSQGLVLARIAPANSFPTALLAGIVAAVLAGLLVAFLFFKRRRSRLVKDQPKA